MRVGGLFSGIGGFDLGLEQAGMSVAWQVEIDEYCNSVLEHHWPSVTLLEDVRDVGKHNLEPVDLICGGFPCQDLSVAGRRAGLDGKRSGLWWEFHRVISEIEPNWVIIENVPGLLSSNHGRDMGTVLGALAELGYGWAYRVLDAQYFGLAQRRRRVFIVGHRRNARCAGEVLFEPQSGQRGIEPIRKKGRISGTLLASGSGTCRTSGRGGEVNYMVVGPLQYSDYKGVNRQYTSAGKIQVTGGLPRRLTPTECERLQGFPDGWTDVGDVTDTPRYKALGNAVAVPVAKWLGERIVNHVIGTATH